MEQILLQVRDGLIGVEEAGLLLQQRENDAGRESRGRSAADLGFAQLDLEREKRTGSPEVIFGEGKTAGQVVAIFKRLMEHSDRVLATRIDGDKAQLLLEAVPEADYNEAARTVLWRRFGNSGAAADHEQLRQVDANYSAPTAGEVPELDRVRAAGEVPELDRVRTAGEVPELDVRGAGAAAIQGGYIAIVCAGTSDLPVAEEAAVTAEYMGCRVERIYDVGVAGIHRLFAKLELIRGADAIVVAAGMEGALASVMGGLVSRPIVAVPTSIGYGANFAGVAPLLSMLNACSPGIAVVNIDNGFGAGYYASLISRGR
ncbi:nickel pincer cofactor biosynthesis protein LarB [Paenibacillus sp. GCM10023252]|uniref:nickel pincer cofactor biosynthesis protein LarB n=1 Tax=Paenibacillus sp. GCM10023252 TaxID=3252649 RepID=UPI0036D42DB0